MRAAATAWQFCRYLTAWAFTLAVSIIALALALLVGPQRMWLWVARPWAQLTLALLGVRLQVTGGEHLSAGASLFISNHQSLIDVVFMPALLPRTTRFIAKRELLWVPFWGWAFAASGAILIDRRRPRQALQQIAAGLRRLPRGWSLIMFPEGTRPKDGSMRPFKRGAFHLAVHSRLPVVPLGMDGAYDIVAPDGWLVRGGEVRVHVGPPLPTTDWQMATIAQHAAAGQAAVADCVAAARRRRPVAAAAGGVGPSLLSHKPLR